MNPRFLFPILAAVLLVLAGTRFIRNGRRLDPAAKTWLTAGAIFAAVSLWLHFAA
jgi:uncharacterized membrane protein YoaK (UPF0700 family)